jgi:hypothetical protein
LPSALLTLLARLLPAALLLTGLRIALLLLIAVRLLVGILRSSDDPPLSGR